METSALGETFLIHSKTNGGARPPKISNQKAPGKGGHHLAPFGPFIPPAEGISVTHLTKNTRSAG